MESDGIGVGPEAGPMVAMARPRLVTVTARPLSTRRSMSVVWFFNSRTVTVAVALM